VSGYLGGPAPPRARSFFERDLPTLEKAPDRGHAGGDPALSQFGLQFRQRDVGRLLIKLEDKRRIALDPTRPTVTPQRPGPDIAGLLHQGEPANRAGGAHPEPRRRLPARHPCLYGFDHPLTQVNRQRFAHACRPPSPACSLNLEGSVWSRSRSCGRPRVATTLKPD